MKLQIKTLNRRSIVIEIEETKTVYELKQELAQYPDIGVKPDLQKVIYAGKILENEEKLSSYNIDTKKFLVVMILKQPLEDVTKTIQQPQQKSADEETTKKEEEDPPVASTSSSITHSTTAKNSEKPTVSKKEEIVSQIVSMGYPKDDVQRALAASFYNPERAIEYLIEGIPTTPSTPEGESGFETDANLSMAPFELFRTDPRYLTLRNSLQQNPEIINDVIRRIGEINLPLSELINENQEEFLSRLIESSDDENDFFLDDDI